MRKSLYIQEEEKENDWDLGTNREETELEKA